MKCTICGYIYDLKKNKNEHNSSDEITFEDLSEEWVCPVCGIGKEMFEKA